MKTTNQESHPESHCHRCKGPNISWAAPSPLWNEVMRSGRITEDGWPWNEIICPTCFAVLAKSTGVADTFWMAAQTTLVPLPKMSVDGRVWNEDTWMWEDCVSDRSGTPQAGNPAEEYSEERGPRNEGDAMKTP